MYAFLRIRAQDLPVTSGWASAKRVSAGHSSSDTLLVGNQITCQYTVGLVISSGFEQGWQMFLFSRKALSQTDTLLLPLSI